MKSNNRLLSFVLSTLTLAFLLTLGQFAWTAPETAHAAIAAPNNIKATLSDGRVGLYWDAVPGASGYNVYVDGVLWNSTPVTTNSLSVSGLTNNSNYQFKVTALDETGESAMSGTLGVSPVDLSGSTYSADLVPKLTSNTSASPILVSASSTIVDGEAWNAFNDTATDKYDFWGTNNIPSGWLQVDFGDGNSKKVGQYTITAKNYIYSPEQSPKDWVFEGSNTGTFTGEQKILDVQSNQSGWVSQEVRTYHFLTDSTYRYYRINFSSTNGRNVLAVGDMELKADQSAQSPVELTLFGIANSTTAVDLSYHTNKSVDHYIVKRGETEIYNGTQTSFTDTGLTSNTAYTYTVEAYDAAGTLLGTRFVTVTTPAGAFSLSATAVATGSTTADVSYTASAPVANYIVKRGSDVIYSGTDTSVSDSGLAPNTTYTYTVEAYDAAGTLLGTQTVSVTMQAAPFVLNLTATANQNCPPSVTLNYYGNQQVSHYLVKRNGQAIYQGINLSFTDSNVAPSTSYTYTVEAYDAAGNLLGSQTVTVKTALDLYATATPVGPYAANLTFVASEQVDHYVVKRGTTVVYQGPNTTFMDSYLQANTQYTYTIEAFNSSNQLLGTKTLTVQTAPMQCGNGTPCSGGQPGYPGGSYPMYQPIMIIMMPAYPQATVPYGYCCGTSMNTATYPMTYQTAPTFQPQTAYMTQPYYMQ